MHALGKFLQELMDERGWKQADLARRSGLSTAVISRLVTKDHLGRMIEEQTVSGLVRAFPEIGRGAFLAKALEAMGIAPEELRTVSVDLEQLSDDALLQELRRRLARRDRILTEVRADPELRGAEAWVEEVLTLSPQMQEDVIKRLTARRGGEGPPSELHFPIEGVKLQADVNEPRGLPTGGEISRPTDSSSTKRARNENVEQS